MTAHNIFACSFEYTPEAATHDTIYLFILALHRKETNTEICKECAE